MTGAGAEIMAKGGAEKEPKINNFSSAIPGTGTVFHKTDR